MWETVWIAGCGWSVKTSHQKFTTNLGFHGPELEPLGFSKLMFHSKINQAMNHWVETDNSSDSSIYTEEAMTSIFFSQNYIGSQMWERVEVKVADHQWNIPTTTILQETDCMDWIYWLRFAWLHDLQEFRFADTDYLHDSHSQLRMAWNRVARIIEFNLITIVAVQSTH